MEALNLNRIKVEIYCTLEDALETLAANQEANMDSFGQYENDEFNDRLNEELQNWEIGN